MTATAVSRDRATIAAIEDGRAIQLFAASDLTKTRRIETKGRTLYCLAISPNGKQVIAGGANPGLSLYEIESGKLVREIKTNDMVLGVDWNRDGTQIVAKVADQKSVQVWDAQSGNLLRDLAIGNTDVNKFALSPDGKLLAVGRWDRFAQVLDFATGRELLQLDVAPQHGNGNIVYAVAFSPSGRLVAAGCSDGTARVWETATGGERFRFIGHNGGVLSVDFSPDGKLLATGSTDRSAVTWDVAPTSTSAALLPLPKDLADAWEKLGDVDARVGLGAIRYLVDRPGDAVALAAKKLSPAPSIENAMIKDLIERLDSPRFAAREQAGRELAALGEAAEAALRSASTSGSDEVRSRATVLLEAIRPTHMTGDRLRGIRIVEAIEHVATTEAKSFLKTLAGGGAAARLTREASDALSRLDSRER
jgi:hypothetical protein